jgi:cyclin A
VWTDWLPALLLLLLPPPPTPNTPPSIKQLAHRPNPDYVFNVQRDMTPHMRRILIDWLVEVAQEYRLTSDTLHLTLDLLNRYLSVAPVAREELQLAGIACMWVASKFEEIYAPTARNFCYITDNTYDVGQLVDMEARVLATLGFTLAGPTAKTFQRRFLQAAAADEQLHYLAAFLLELSLMDEQLLHLLPSQVAAGSVYLARAMLGRAPWDATLAHYSGHAEADVGPVAAELAFTHHTIAADGSFGAILDKYSSERLLCVSGLPAHALMSRCTRWAAHQVAAAAAAATAGSSSSDDEAHGSPAGAAGGMCSEASSDMELV